MFSSGIHPGWQSISRAVGSWDQSPWTSAAAPCDRGIVDSPKLSVVGCRGTGDPDDKWIFAAFVFEILAKPVGFQTLKKS